jgi:hypothetical protein
MAVPALGTAVFVTAVCLALAQTVQFVTIMLPRRDRHEIHDMLAFAGAHRDTIAMGYGSDESLSLERPALIFRTGLNPIDQPAIREYQMQGVPLPAATVEALGRCDIRYWLIPKGEEPFSGRNSYDSVLGQPLYPSAFRNAFRRSYSLVESTEYYDAWQCVPEPRR